MVNGVSYVEEKKYILTFLFLYHGFAFPFFVFFCFNMLFARDKMFFSLPATAFTALFTNPPHNPPFSFVSYCHCPAVCLLPLLFLSVLYFRGGSDKL